MLGPVRKTVTGWLVLPFFPKEYGELFKDVSQFVFVFVLHSLLDFVKHRRRQVSTCNEVLYNGEAIESVIQFVAGHHFLLADYAFALLVFAVAVVPVDNERFKDELGDGWIRRLDLLENATLLPIPIVIAVESEVLAARRRRLSLGGLTTAPCLCPHWGSRATVIDLCAALN